MKAYISLFRVGNTKISVHWSFLLMVAVVLLVHSFMQDDGPTFVLPLILVFVLFSSVLLHEFAHVIVARRFGIHTRNIVLWPMGGVSLMDRSPGSPWQEILISLAGPAANMIVALLLMPFVVENFSVWPSLSLTGYYSVNDYLYYLYSVNWGIAMFNIIPAFPLDGGRAFRGALALKFKPNVATHTAVLISRIIAGGLILAGLFSFNIILAVVAVLVIMAGSAEEQFSYLRQAVRGLHATDFVEHGYDVLSDNATVSEISLSLQKSVSIYFVIMVGKRPLAVVARNSILIALAEGRSSLPLAHLVRPAPPIFGNLDMEMVAEAFAKTGAEALPVISDEGLIGIIELDKIVERLLIKQLESNTIGENELLVRLLQ